MGNTRTSIYKNTVKTLKQNQELIDLYRDDISSESLTGVISNYSDELIYMSLFTDEGLPNGISVFYWQDITRIRWGGNLRDPIGKLILLNESKPQISDINLDSLRLALESIQSEFGYVNILTESVDPSITFVGEISEIDQEALVLNSYGTMSTLDRNFQLMTLEVISRVDAGASYENSIYQLLESKN